MDTINKIVSENIRSIRQKKDISLEELSKISGVSKSMLVQIEKGNGNPSLSTLWKIANSLMIPFNELVTRPTLPYELVRISELDPILEESNTIKNYVLYPGDLQQKFSIYYMEIQPGSGWTSEMHMRGTIEFITVFSGELLLTLENKSFTLKKGDSIRFGADIRHSYENIGEETLEFHNILYNG